MAPTTTSSRLRPAAPRLCLAIGMTALVVACLAFVFVAVRASLLAQVTEEANTHVEAGVEQFITYAETAADPLTGRAFESGPRLVESYLSHQVPGPDDALAADVDGEIIQMESAGRRIESGSALAGGILSSPVGSGVVNEADGGSVHWGRVEVNGSHIPVTLVVARWTDSARERADAQLTTHAGLAGLTAGVAAVLSWFLAGRLTLAPGRRDVGKHGVDERDTDTPRDDARGHAAVLTHRIAADLQSRFGAEVRLVAVAEPVPVEADAAHLTTALLPAVRTALQRSGGGPVDFGTTLKGVGPGRVLSLWLRDCGAVVPRGRLPELLTGPGASLGTTARGFGGRAWAESAAGLGTILGVDLPVSDRA